MPRTIRRVGEKLKEANANDKDVVERDKGSGDKQSEWKDVKKKDEREQGGPENGHGITNNNEDTGDIKEALRLPPIGEGMANEERSNNEAGGETGNKEGVLKDKGSIIVLDVKTSSNNTDVLNVAEDKTAKNEDSKKKTTEAVEEKKIVKFEAEKLEEEKKKDKVKKRSNTLFTIFDKNKALKFNYNSATGESYSFLENAEELKVIKQIIAEQLDPEIKKKRIEEQRKKESMQAELEAIKANTSTIIEKKQEGGKIKRILSLKSLVYFNDKDWIVRVNKQIIPYKDKDNLKNDVVSILKVDKTSVVFVMNATDELLVKKVNDLISKNVPYKNSYFVIRQKHKTYVAFKLYIGQRIDLNTMKIGG